LKKSGRIILPSSQDESSSPEEEERAAGVDTLKKTPATPEEIQRQLSILSKTKTGRTMALFFGAVEQQKQLVWSGKKPLGFSKQEALHLFTQMGVVLSKMREFYVEEHGEEILEKAGHKTEDEAAAKPGAGEETVQ
jgi:hypothetical protein